MPTTQQLISCCVEVLGGTVNVEDNECNAVISASNGMVVPFDLDDACYWAEQLQASQPTVQNAFNPTAWGNFLSGAGSFLGSLFGLVNPPQTPTPGTPPPPPPTPEEDAKNRQTLIVLGLITLAVVGVAVFYIIKKTRKK